MRIVTNVCFMLALIAVAPACDSSEPGSTDTNVDSDSDGSETGEPVTLCAMIPGSHYRTVKEYALGPGEPATSKLPLDFDEEGGYAQSHGDYIEEGNYTCTDGVITATSTNFDSEWTATINEDASMLVIGESQEYERVDE